MNFRCAAKRFIAAIVIIVAAFMPATAYPVRAVNYRGCCDYVYVGGEIIGFEAKIDGVLVTDAQSVGVEGWQIKTSLKKGDVIKEIEGDENAKLDKYATTDSPEYKELVERIRARFGLTSLKFNTLETLIEAIGLPKCKVCTHCFDGSSCF